jgi:uncharacterized protein
MDVSGLYKAVAQQFAKHHQIGHDIKHATRVAALSKYIAEHEGYDSTEAEIAGLLHDIGRTVQDKEEGHGPAGVVPAQVLLDRYTDYDQTTKSKILFAVEHHSELHTSGTLTHIVQDADKLDGMGAIGIIRSCASKHQSVDYNPGNVIPAQGIKGRTIVEHIAWLMTHLGYVYTDTAKDMAKERYDFMAYFLRELQAEVEM